MLDPRLLFKFKSMMDVFNRNHPKVIPYMHAVSQEALKENTIVDIKFTTEEGECLHTNLKLNKDDIEMFKQLFSMAKQ